MCKHDKGFVLVPGTLVGMSDYPGLWVCKARCGFHLNFNPEDFLEGIAFLDKPNEKGKKVLPALVSSKRG